MATATATAAAAAAAAAATATLSFFLSFAVASSEFFLYPTSEGRSEHGLEDTAILSF